MRDGPTPVGRSRAAGDKRDWAVVSTHSPKPEALVKGSAPLRLVAP